MVLAWRLLLIFMLLGLFRGTPLQYIFLVLYYVLAVLSIISIRLKAFYLVIFGYFVFVQYINAVSFIDFLLTISLPLSIPFAIYFSKYTSIFDLEKVLLRLCMYYTIVYVFFWSIIGNNNFEIYNFISQNISTSRIGALDILPITAFLIYLTRNRHVLFLVLLFYFIFYIKFERGLLISLVLYYFYEQRFLVRKFRKVIVLTIFVVALLSWRVAYGYMLLLSDNLYAFTIGQKIFDSSLNSRIEQIAYVFSDVSWNRVLFGHGIPRETSKYLQLTIDYFYWQDNGILGIYWAFGLVGLFLILSLIAPIVKSRREFPPLLRILTILYLINSLFTAKILFVFGFMIVLHCFKVYDYNNRSLR